MLFTHFASINELPGFYKSGTLPAPNVRNPERRLLSLTGLGTKSEIIYLDSPRSIRKHICLLKFA